MKSVAKGGLNDWVKYKSKSRAVLLPQRVAQAVAMDQPANLPAGWVLVRDQTQKSSYYNIFTDQLQQPLTRSPGRPTGLLPLAPHRSANPPTAPLVMIPVAPLLPCARLPHKVLPRLPRSLCVPISNASAKPPLLVIHLMTLTKKTPRQISAKLLRITIALSDRALIEVKAQSQDCGRLITDKELAHSSGTQPQ